MTTEQPRVDPDGPASSDRPASEGEPRSTTSQTLTVERTQFSTEDRAVVEAMFAASNGDGLQVEASPDVPFALEQSSASDGTVMVSKLRFTGRVSAVLDRSSQVVFNDVAEGRYDWRSRETRGDQERPLILPVGHDLAVRFEGVRSVLINLDASTVERWLARYGGMTPSPALLQAVSGSDAVRSAIRVYGEVMPSPAFDSALVRASLLDVLLSVTAHQLMPHPSRAQLRHVPAALTRAEEYLRAHAGEAISVADAAKAAQLSIRGLHNQFRTWLHITPGQYLRNIRLEKVHAALLEARDTGEPVRVADVARAWGFTHLGRFAATYAAAFGELPSSTLGRRP